MKFFLRLGLFLGIFLFTLQTPVYAQFTLLPETSLNREDCLKVIDTFISIQNPGEDSDTKPDNITDLLGCGIKTGRITLAMIPYYVKYLSDFVLGLIGLVSLFFVVVGGYFYTVSGITDDKEKGKNTIKHALMGLGVALLAWTIVNVIIQAITG